MVIIKWYNAFGDDAVFCISREILRICPSVTHLYVGNCHGPRIWYPEEPTPHVTVGMRSWWRSEWDVSGQREGEIVVVDEDFRQVVKNSH